MPVAEKHHLDWKRPALQAWIGPIILFLLVVAFYWKLVLTNQYTWLESPDITSMVMPWFQFQAGEWHHGRFPLWDPYGWGGQPLLGQAQPGAAYPLNWLLFLMPLKNGWMQQIWWHWYYVIIHFLAALSAYWLARDLDRSRAASILAGCAFGLAGYVATTDWPQMVNGAVWAPLVLMFLLRAVRGQRPVASAIFSGFFLGVSWLAGHHQMQIFLSLAVAGLWLFLFLRQGRPDWTIVRLAAISILFAILASGLQTVPTAEYGKLAQRWSGPDQPLKWNEIVPYNIHKQYQLRPLSLLGIAIPTLRSMDNPFIGTVALSLGILGIALGWRDATVRWLATIAVGGLFFALGSNSLMHGVMYSVLPLIEKARVPAAAILMFNLGISPLIAFGIDHLAEEGAAVWSRRIGWVAGALAAVLFLASLLFSATHLSVSITDDRLVMTALLCALLAGLLYAWRRGYIRRGAAVACLVLLVLTELSNEIHFSLPHVSEKERNLEIRNLSTDSDIVEFIRQKEGLPRVGYDLDVIKHNIGPWYGMETFQNYVAGVPVAFWQREVFSPRFQDMMGVGYYIGLKPNRPDAVEVFTGASGHKVYRIPSAFSRAWAVHQVDQVRNEAEAKNHMADPAYNLFGRTFLTEAPPALEQCPGDEDVQLVLHRPNYVNVTANLHCKGMVILDDNVFPGWTATVDGKPAQIYEAYEIVRGVVAGAGRHTIEFHYRPRSVYLGALMSLTALVTVLLLAFRRHPRTLRYHSS